MNALHDSIRSLKGIGDAKAKALEKMDLRTLEDLLNNFPRAYEDRRTCCPISEASPDRPVCIRATVASAPQSAFVRRGMELLKFRASDESGSVYITYFHQNYLKEQFQIGTEYIFYGKVEASGRRRSMTNPVFEPVGRQGTLTGRILPVYRLSAGISQKLLMGLTRQVLDQCRDQIPAYLPPELTQKLQLAQAPYAYENIHFPRDDLALDQARRRLVFEELFVLCTAIGTVRRQRKAGAGPQLTVYPMEPFWTSLPFQPTEAQRRAVREAMSDMSYGIPLSRLLQGVVGRGKTLVAAALIWQAFQNGLQSALMAPTEILADQHYTTLTQLLEPLGLRLVRLTGAMKAAAKRQANQLLSSGQAHAVVGTHALLSASVSFQNLALVITDEQHRFGVEQRSALAEKGRQPHVLVMSATPIPRTLALILYGDLDISVLDQLPPGRQKVDTFALGESMRERIWRFVRRLVQEGRQVFVVCPMVEENQDLGPEVKSAETWARVLQQDIFPDLRVGCVHGRMKGREKDAVMASFAAGELDILVSTTVVEVGVDVPNAALMIVENADRFGLSQLHQLRGRVGRGSHKSYCVLFSSSDTPEAMARLSIMTKTNDGFRISEEDLRLRGPGDFLGSRQHGLPEMHVADLSADMRVLKQAQTEAADLLESDPTLALPAHRALRERVQALLADQTDIFS